MAEVNVINTEDGIEVVDSSEYLTEIDECFIAMPSMAIGLKETTKKLYRKIEKLLYSAPAFINVVKASVPEELLHAVLTDEQKEQIAKGALKLMTKKDGTLLANLINPETKKIVATVPLKEVKFAPEMTQAMTNYATQMQMAQIAEQIQHVQIAIEQVRQGQENDRLALAYSVQQKLIQAMEIEKPRLKENVLLKIASDAEDSRNALMLSQRENIKYISEQPESAIGKFFSGAKPEEIDSRINEIRDGLNAVNLVSFAEAMAYQELGETKAARLSLKYYADFLNTAYIENKGLVERLDMLDPSPDNYWTERLPDITSRIDALPCNEKKQSRIEEH